MTLAAALTGGLRWHTVPVYIVAQIAGAIMGVWLAHVMFELPVLQLSTHVRSGLGQWVAVAIATFGLLATIWGCRALAGSVTAFAVAAYITSAYWFTAPPGGDTSLNLTPRVARTSDAAAIAAIYNEGITDRIATFETEPRWPEHALVQR